MSTELDLSWEVDFWGRLNDRVRAGRPDYEAVQADHEASLSDIITVLESQRRSFLAQRDLLSTRNLRLQNRINLHLALGGSFLTPPRN